MKRRFLASLAVLTAAAFAAQTAQAALLVYEPFDYAVGSDILGQGGATNGFTGDWRVHTGGAVPAGSFTTVAGSLAHPSAALPTTGNSAILTGEFGTLQPARDFNEIAGGDGTTTWVSYIGQRQGDPFGTANNLYNRGVNVGVFDADETANPGRAERMGIGNSSNAADNEWSLIAEGSGGQRAGSGTPFTDLEWAVMRIDHHGDHTVPDDFYLWLSPDPAVEPTTGTADVTIIGSAPPFTLSGTAIVEASGIDFVRPFVGNMNSSSAFGVLIMDELRIGTDYASMSATRVVPEPATAGLLALAGGLALAIRRRR